MRLDEEYCLSEYVDLGRLGDNEKVHIVRNQVNGVIGVRKYVALDLDLSFFKGKSECVYTKDL